MKGDWKRIKKVGRYLKGRPRLVYKYKWQGRVEDGEVFNDSDWAGCRRTAKSTSGGTILMGSHVLKHWSRTQKTIALSSGEAELTASVKGVCEGLGVKALYQDWGIRIGMTSWSDSSAAMGVIDRKGAGKMRHVDIGILWIQQRKEEDGINFRKVGGTANPADGLTKYLPPKDVNKHLEMVSGEVREGRASKGIQLATDAVVR